MSRYQLEPWPKGKWMGVDQLSRYTGMPSAWLRREADAGRLPHIRVGKSRMFDLESVLKNLSDRGSCATKSSDKPAIGATAESFRAAARDGALKDLEAVLCDPDGNVCVGGSNEDRRIIREALDALKTGGAP